MNNITKIYRWFLTFFFNKQQKITATFPIDEEMIKKDRIVQEMAKKLQSQDAQLSKIFAEKKSESDKTNPDESLIQKVSELENQKQELTNKKFKNSVSLKKIFKELSKPKYKKKKYQIDVTDKDDKVILGKFNDFIILPDGSFGISGTDGKMLSYGKTLRQVIYKPESLANQFKRRRITLPCNEDYIFIPDIEEYELPECSYDEESGKIKWAKIREKPLKKLIIEREMLIRDKDMYIEKIEQDKVDLVRKLRDVERASRIHKNIGETSQTELSKAMDMSIQFEQKVGDLQMRVVKLQELQLINERLLDGIKNINQELVTKAEEMGSKTEFRKALDLTQNLISYAHTKIPKTIIQEVKQEAVKETIKPGQKV